MGRYRGRGRRRWYRDGAVAGCFNGLVVAGVGWVDGSYGRNAAAVETTAVGDVDTAVGLGRVGLFREAHDVSLE